MSDQLSFNIGDVEKTAVISSCGNYRYELIRRWSDGHLLEWVMLNPSTADADVDDNTIRRCMSFAKAWGFNGIRVTNLFALRSTNPNQLVTTDLDAIGPDNHHHLQKEYGPITMCGWGTNKAVEKHWATSTWAAILLARSALMCLGYNNDGSPKHPLYVKSTAGARPWPKPNPKERHY